MRTIELQFSVSGTCDQTIELADDCTLTGEEIADALNGNYKAAASDIPGDKVSLLTTVQEGGELVAYYPDGSAKVLGKVINSNMDAEYLDFDYTGE